MPIKSAEDIMKRENMEMLSVQDLGIDYRLKSDLFRRRAKRVVAVDKVSFSLQAGQCMALVGETGSGKTSIARALMGLQRPARGRILYSLTAGERAVDPYLISRAELNLLRRDFQVIFQEALSALNPRHCLERILSEPLISLERITDRREIRMRIEEVIEEVGLPRARLGAYPHQFSGGQRQRILIARALVTRPGLLIADEPFSALDGSVQAQIINLLLDLRERHNLSLLVISHDLSIVRVLCDTMVVLRSGEVVEQGPVRDLFLNPVQDYSRKLFSAVLSPTPQARAETVVRLRACGKGKQGVS